jgi:hypothetical protein
MATSNLKNKTLGKIEFGSGIGTPNHVENTGSLYIEASGSSISKYVASGTTIGWEVIPRGSFGGGYTTGTTAQVISSTTAWVAMTGGTYTWVGGTMIGFSHSQGVFTVLSGNSGYYSINGFCYINYNTTTNEYQSGISVNTAIPSIREYYGASLHDTSFSLNKTISFNIQRRLNVGDKINTVIRGITSTSTVNIKAVGITFQRIYD